MVLHEPRTGGIKPNLANSQHPALFALTIRFALVISHPLRAFARFGPGLSLDLSGYTHAVPAER